MEYQWNEAKRLTNLRKHGIDFTDIPSVFDGDIETVFCTSCPPINSRPCYGRYLRLIVVIEFCQCVTPKFIELPYATDACKHLRIDAFSNSPNTSPDGLTTSNSDSFC